MACVKRPISESSRDIWCVELEKNKIKREREKSQKERLKPDP